MPGTQLQRGSRDSKAGPVLGEREGRRETGLTKATRWEGHWGPRQKSDQDAPGREGLSEGVTCSFQQSATVLGTRRSAGNQTKGAPALRELNSRWGASAERQQVDEEGECVYQTVVSGREEN